MAWLVRCKHCLTEFPVTKDCVQTADSQNVSELDLACPECGQVAHYSACDLQPPSPDAITPLGAAADLKRGDDSAAA